MNKKHLKQNIISIIFLIAISISISNQQCALDPNLISVTQTPASQQNTYQYVPILYTGVEEPWFQSPAADGFLYQNVPNFLKNTILLKSLRAIGSSDLTITVNTQMPAGSSYSVYLTLLQLQGYVGISHNDLISQGWSYLSSHSITVVLPQQDGTQSVFQFYLYHKQITGPTFSLPQIINGAYAGSIMLNCDQITTNCLDNQYIDINNQCANCLNPSCKLCNLNNDRSKCTHCYQNEFLYLLNNSCIQAVNSCQNVDSTNFYISQQKLPGFFYGYSSQDKQVQYIYQQAQCTKFLDILEYNLQLRQACQQKLDDFINYHKQELIKIILQGCKVQDVVNKYTTEKIYDPPSTCQIYADPHFKLFDGTYIDYQGIYQQVTLFENMFIKIEFSTYQMPGVPTVSLTSEIYITYKTYSITPQIFLQKPQTPVVTAGFVNGVKVTQMGQPNNYLVEFENLPTTSVMIQQYSNTYNIFITSPESQFDSGLCIKQQTQRILQSTQITQHQVCEGLTEHYKNSCNFDVSVTGDESWAINAQNVEQLHFVQENFAVQASLQASSNQCPFATYPDQQGDSYFCSSCHWKSLRPDVTPNWCKQNCCTGKSRNQHPACDGSICLWHCPNQAYNADGCNVFNQSTNQGGQVTQNCQRWAATAQFPGWDEFCSHYCQQYVINCQQDVQLKQICQCVQY